MLKSVLKRALGLGTAVVEGARIEGESISYLDVTLLEGWPHRRAGLWGCRKVRKNLDSTPLSTSGMLA